MQLHGTRKAKKRRATHVKRRGNAQHFYRITLFLRVRTCFWGIKRLSFRGKGHFVPSEWSDEATGTIQTTAEEK